MQTKYLCHEPNIQRASEEGTWAGETEQAPGGEDVGTGGRENGLGPWGGEVEEEGGKLECKE